MADQSRDLSRAAITEIRKIGRQIQPAIVGHQILDAVEVAAEGEVVHPLLAAAALPVQVDGDQALRPAVPTAKCLMSPTSDLSTRSFCTLRTPVETYGADTRRSGTVSRSLMSRISW